MTRLVSSPAPMASNNGSARSTASGAVAPERLQAVMNAAAAAASKCEPDDECKASAAVSDAVRRRSGHSTAHSPRPTPRPPPRGRWRRGHRPRSGRWPERTGPGDRESATGGRAREPRRTRERCESGAAAMEDQQRLGHTEEPRGRRRYPRRDASARLSAAEVHRGREQP